MPPKNYYSSLVVLVLASLVFTAPAPGGVGGASQCDTGEQRIHRPKTKKL